MIKPDNIIMASLFPSYINTGNSTADMIISGTVMDGGFLIFTAYTDLAPDQNISNIYATNKNTSLKCSLGAGSYIPVLQLTGSGEYSTYSITNVGDSIQLVVFVNNFTGGPVVLITQTLHIEAVNYQLPF